jgi:hypothetical protein
MSWSLKFDDPIELTNGETLRTCAMPTLRRRRRDTIGGRCLRSKILHTGSPPSARGVLVYCADYHCSHSASVIADRWADDLRLSDLEPRLVCSACGKRGADIPPDFNWNKTPAGGMGYR